MFMNLQQDFTKTEWKGVNSPELLWFTLGTPVPRTPLYTGRQNMSEIIRALGILKHVKVS